MVVVVVCRVVSCRVVVLETLFLAYWMDEGWSLYHFRFLVSSSLNRPYSLSTVYQPQTSVPTSRQQGANSPLLILRNCR
jgi:hypothetical protein